MSIPAPKAPATFADAQKKRALESQQAMTRALKEHRFDDALEHARTALALDPNNAMVKEFIRLLEEKAALDDTDDDNEPGTSGVRAAASDEESEDEDEDDEDDEGETGEGEDEEEEEEEESEEDDPAVIKALERLRLAAPKDPGEGPAPPRMSRSKLHTLRASLSANIKEMLLAELAKEMASDDPLLGA